MTVPRSRRSRQGFSLAEMLTVIGIIAVMTGIIIPRILAYNDKFTREHMLRLNAANVAMAASAATGAGGRVVQGDGLEAAVRRVIAGVKVEEGPLAGRIFSVPGISNADIPDMLQFLALRDDQILYLAGTPKMDSP